MLTEDGPVPIDEMEIGQRAITDRAQLEPGGEDDCPTEVDDRWTLWTLELDPGDGGPLLRIETLKSQAWALENGAAVGNLVWIELEELGLRGMARVLGARGPPTVADGPGCVVLSTYTRWNNRLLELTLASGEALEVTDSHRLYSATRDRWVSAGTVREGEFLRTADALLPITGVVAVAGTHQVFNLEVEGKHRYLVGPDEVLAHNAGGQTPKCCKGSAGGAAGGGGQFRDASGRLRNSDGTFARDPAAASSGRNVGRGGDQQRLRQLLEDPNTPRHIKGWIKQELNAIKRGQRSRIRRPPGHELAHTRGREAAKGYDHVTSPSEFKTVEGHTLQHRHDDMGRLNPRRGDPP